MKKILNLDFYDPSCMKKLLLNLERAKLKILEII